MSSSDPNPLTYFLAGVTRAVFDRDPAATLGRVGLGHLGTSLTVVECEPGDPIHASGLLLRKNVLGQPVTPIWSPKTQRWVKLDVDLWVGAELDNLPTPDDFAREDQALTAGSNVRDQAGRVWRIPVADASGGDRCSLPTPTLPVEYDFDLATGHAIAHPKHQYRDLLEAAGRAWEWFSDRVELTPSERAMIASQALSVNYVLTPIEHHAMYALGSPIIDDTFATTVCWVICGGPLVDESEKKKETEGATDLPPSGSDTKPGDAA